MVKAEVPPVAGIRDYAKTYHMKLDGRPLPNELTIVTVSVIIWVVDEANKGEHFRKLLASTRGNVVMILPP
jgi:hypothetical protein